MLGHWANISMQNCTAVPDSADGWNMTVWNRSEIFTQ